MKISDIVFKKELYPRFDFDNTAVNLYRKNTDNLPPIIIQKKSKILIDGYHRLIAHRLEKKETIETVELDIPENQILIESIKRNSKHGKQLAMEEKRNLAQQLFNNGFSKVDKLAMLLAVTHRAVEKWTFDLRQNAKNQRNQQILEMYLACKSSREIEKIIGIDHTRILKIIGDFTKKFENTPPDSLQLYNVWYFATRDKQYGLDFQGAIPGQILENILYYYTNPFDVVVDPMAGGGTTIDVCKAAFRRWRAYDMKPVRDDIIEHDISVGFPKECKNCDMIFLDPPYYNMVFNLWKNVNEFYNFIERLAKDCFGTVKENGIVAILIQHMTDKENQALSGETYRIFRSAGFKCIDQISCPLSTEQWTAPEVQRAKDAKYLMGRNRDLWVFKK